MNDDCIFCKIVGGKIPSSKVYEDKVVYAFLDINPVKKGHTLVIPKEHYETYLDIPESTLKDFAVVLKRVAIAVKLATSAEGVNITMNNYKAAGQVVPHAHFHIIPRHMHDGLHSWPSGKYDGKEIEDFRSKILGHL
jgi:histidine triad (HIT) family protein